jgi:hypothetical protein
MLLIARHLLLYFHKRLTVLIEIKTNDLIHFRTRGSVVD